MQLTHGYVETSLLTGHRNHPYIGDMRERHGRFEPKDNSMANSFFRNALNRVVVARERQVSRYVNGALLSLDDQTLQSLGTSREELRRKGATSYIF
jgi:hypothetical protein